MSFKSIMDRPIWLWLGKWGRAPAPFFCYLVTPLSSTSCGKFSRFPVISLEFSSVSCKVEDHDGMIDSRRGAQAENEGLLDNTLWWEIWFRRESNHPTLMALRLAFLCIWFEKKKSSKSPYATFDLWKIDRSIIASSSLRLFFRETSLASSFECSTRQFCPEITLSSIDIWETFWMTIFEDEIH